MNLPCCICEEYTTTHIEIIEVMGNRECKGTICSNCFECIKKLVFGMRERAKGGIVEPHTG